MVLDSDAGYASWLLRRGAQGLKRVASTGLIRIHLQGALEGLACPIGIPHLLRDRPEEVQRHDIVLVEFGRTLKGEECFGKSIQPREQLCVGHVVLCAVFEGSTGLVKTFVTEVKHRIKISGLRRQKASDPVCSGRSLAHAPFSKIESKESNPCAERFGIGSQRGLVMLSC